MAASAPLGTVMSWRGDSAGGWGLGAGRIIHEWKADSARSRRKPLEQAVLVARKTRRRPATGRAGLNGGGPRSTDDKPSRVFPACGRRFSKRMCRVECHVDE